MPQHAPMLFHLPLLAQYDDDPVSAPPAPAPARPMTIRDLNQGFRDVHDGKVDTSRFRNGIIVLLVLVALVALLIHLRQRRKAAAPPESLGKLARELSRNVSFPLGARLMLKWVARTTQTPYPALLLSSDLFDQCVATWAGEHTFAVARHWGQSRLNRLRPRLFD